MDLKKATVQELKETAYDQMVLIENAQRNLQVINQEIQLRQVEPEVKKEELKK